MAKPSRVAAFPARVPRSGGWCGGRDLAVILLTNFDVTAWGRLAALAWPRETGWDQCIPDPGGRQSMLAGAAGQRRKSRRPRMGFVSGTRALSLCRSCISDAVYLLEAPG